MTISSNNNLNLSGAVSAAIASPANGWKLTDTNYDHTVLVFRERQAGISVIYDPDAERYSYNVYCVETKLLKELFTVEFDFLEDALSAVNDEFGTWEKVDLSAKKGCGTCVAKGN